MLSYYQIERQMNNNSRNINNMLAKRQQLDEAFNTLDELDYGRDADRVSKRRYVPGLGIDQNPHRRVVRLGRLMIAW